MKKSILILIIMMLLFTGCNKDEMSKINNDNEVKVQDNVIDDNKVQGIIDNEEEVLDNNSDEIIVEPMEEVTTTTTTTTKKVTAKKTTKKTTKKATTSRVTTTVKSETTTTKKAEEDTLKFYFPIDKGNYIRVRDNLNNVYIVRNRVAFYAPIDTPVYSTAKGKIYSVVHYVSSCNSPNPRIDLGNIMIVHEDSEGTLYSSYGCVKNPVFSKADIGKEVTENTVIGYVGKRVVPRIEKQITSFVFSIRKKSGYDPAWDLEPRKYLNFPSDEISGRIDGRY